MEINLLTLQKLMETKPQRKLLESQLKELQPHIRAGDLMFLLETFFFFGQAVCMTVEGGNRAS